MSPLSTLAVSAAAARSLQAVLRPAAAASESFLDLLRADDSSAPASPLAPEDAPTDASDTPGQALAESLRALIATLAGGPDDQWDPSEQIRVELSPLQHVYVDGGTARHRDLEMAIERDPTLMAALRQWFAHSGQDAFEMRVGS